MSAHRCPLMPRFALPCRWADVLPSQRRTLYGPVGRPLLLDALRVEKSHYRNANALRRPWPDDRPPVDRRGRHTLLAIGLMAWDHLWGNERGSDDSFPADPATFFVTMALIVATGLVVFGVTVPRATDRPATVHRAALIHSGIAVVLALPASWMGFPVVLAGGGIALGIHALGGERRRPAVVAIDLGVLVVLCSRFSPQRSQPLIAIEPG